MSFVFGKCKVVLANQNSWPIARKELVAALNTTKLLKQASEGLQISNCSNFFWCDFCTVLQWLKNPDLRLSKFITRRVDHILMLSSETEWRFCPSNLNAADVGSRPDSISKIEARALWLKGPSFLRQHRLLPSVDSEVAVTARRMKLSGDGLDVIGGLIERAPSLYQLQKRIAIILLLPLARLAANKKPFFHCGIDYLGPLTFVEGGSHRKAWGLLFTCKASRAIHVELVTALSLDEFLLAFTRFVDIRGQVDTIYSDNGSTFQAGSRKLPELIESKVLNTSLRKKV